MTRNDTVGLIGLTLALAGFGGGYELMVLAQSQAYREMLLAGGNANPAQLANGMSQAMNFLAVGTPVGMLGVILLAVAVRGYFLSIVTRLPANT